MKRFVLVIFFFAAGCVAQVVTTTPPAAFTAETPPSPTPTVTLTPSATLVPTAAPTVTTFPILLTVVPRAAGAISVRTAICQAQHTQYRLWPYKLEIFVDEAGYQACLEERRS